MRKAHIPPTEITPPRRRPPVKKTPIAPPDVSEDDPTSIPNVPIVPFDHPPQRREPDKPLH